MSDPVGQALVAAILATGDLITPRKMGILPGFLENDAMAQQALALIYKYADSPGTFGQVPAPSYLAANAVPFFTSHDPAAGSVAALCEVIKVNRVRAIWGKIIQESSAACALDPIEAINRLRTGIEDRELTALISSGAKTSFGNSFELAVRKYRATQHTHGIVGASMPFPTMNMRLKGWRAGGFYDFFAPEKNFKTFLGLKAIEHLHTGGRRTAVVSTEMSEEQMTVRLLCIILGLDFNRFIDRELDSDTIAELEDLIPVFRARFQRDIHYLFPTGTGAQALAEVKAFIQDINTDGQLALVLWDGHYRSAEEEKWEAIYNLTRGTKRLCMDDATYRCPILATTQEGSEEGRVAYRVYGQEADAHMRIKKTAADKAILASKALREGRDFLIQLQLDFSHSTITETANNSDQLEQPGATF